MASAPPPAGPPAGSDKEAERPGKIKVSLAHTSSKKKRHSKRVSSKGY